MPKCIELLSCDWLISSLCYQAIEQVYLIKWPVSIYMKNVLCLYVKYIIYNVNIRIYIHVNIYVCVFIYAT